MTCLQTYGIFVEFLFIMGVNWISEVNEIKRCKIVHLIFFQSASFFVKWLDPPHWDNTILFVLEIINWNIGIIMLILFIKKQSNRSMILDLLRSSEGDSVTLRTYSSQLSSDTTSSDNSKLNPLAFKRSLIK